MQPIELQNAELSEVGATADEGPIEPHISLTEVCVNPLIGENQLIAYIVDDMTRDECRDFAAHVAECTYCFKQVVLWRLAQVIVEDDDRRDATETDHESNTNLCHGSPPLFTMSDNPIVL
jgi:hypothetical protein